MKPSPSHRNSGPRPSPGAHPAVNLKPWETLEEVLRRELGNIPMDWEGALCLSRLSETWTSVAGPVLAGHSAPGELRGESLLVWVDNSTWLAELSRLHAHALLEKIRKVDGCTRIQRIEFRLNPDLHRAPRKNMG